MPVYQQLADILRERIRTGELPPETILPGELEMARLYKVGRNAVRQALDVLRSEALIITTRGENSRVRAQPQPREVPLPSGARVRFRQPTPAERAEIGIDEGVGLVVVETGDGEQVLPADEVVLTVP